MYAEDSFFTLSMAGRISVLCISITLSLLLLYLAWRLMAGRAWYWRLLIAVVLFYLFVWLAPQFYYTYYIYYFDDLPWQLVIYDPPTPRSLFNMVTFTDRANLSFHSQGVLGWAFILMAIFRPYLGRKKP